MFHNFTSIWMRIKCLSEQNIFVNQAPTIPQDGDILIQNNKAKIFLGNTWVDATNCANCMTNVFDIFGDGSAVALYRFDGNANDDGGRYNGIWHGHEQYAPGKFGQAAKFDGSSYIVITPKPELEKQFAISFWINPNDVSDYTGVIQLVNTNGDNRAENLFEFWLKGYDHNVTELSINGTYYALHPPEEILNKWTHYVLIVSDKTYVFRNGVLIKTINDTPDMSKYTRFQIGSDWDANNPNTENFKGLLDQLRIFNRALTEEEIQILYHEGDNC